MRRRRGTLFDQAGIFDVALTVSNGSNEVSLTEPAYIQVLEVGAMETPFEDSFEAAELSDDWFMVDVSNDGDGWEVVTASLHRRPFLAHSQLVNQSNTTEISSLPAAWTCPTRLRFRCRTSGRTATRLG